MSKSIFAALILFLTCGCSDSDNPSAYDFKLDNIPEDTIKGRYLPGWEWSAFMPCNSSEYWSLDGGTSQFSSIYGSVASDNKPTVFIQAKGSVSELGKYGHMGMNVRYFRIDELFEMRQPFADDCNDVPFNFESYSSTADYDGLTVYLDTYISISKVNAPAPDLGYMIEIKMKSLQGVTPSLAITNVELSVLRDNVNLWTAMPYGLDILQEENALLFLFKSDPFGDSMDVSYFYDVDLVFKLIYGDKEVTIIQNGMPVNF